MNHRIRDSHRHHVGKGRPAEEVVEGAARNLDLPTREDSHRRGVVTGLVSREVSSGIGRVVCVLVREVLLKFQAEAQRQRDRVGANFPVVADTACRNTVFNSVAQSAAEYVGRMRELGLRTFRIDLLRENAEQAKQLLDRYARVIAGRDDGRETWRQLRVLNQLGVTRGTLQVV